MSAEQNKMILRRIPEEVFNKGNLAVAGEVFAVDYIDARVSTTRLPLRSRWPQSVCHRTARRLPRLPTYYPGR